jgi:hypothetical protein
MRITKSLVPRDVHEDWDLLLVHASLQDIDISNCFQFWFGECKFLTLAIVGHQT